MDRKMNHFSYRVLRGAHYHRYKLKQVCASSHGRATRLGSGGADILHALDAADAAVGDFSAGQADVVPVTPLTVEPAAGRLREQRTHAYSYTVSCRCVNNICNVWFLL